MEVLDRFLRYARLDTQSDPTSSAVPSTPGQLVMLQLLADELREMGAEDVELVNGACLMATIPATVSVIDPTTAPRMGFAAWTCGESTASFGSTVAVSDFSAPPTPLQGAQNEPQGGSNGTSKTIGFIAHVDTSPDAPGRGVKPIVSGDWVTSDGTTLLGADDKAGVAIIMTAAEYLLAHPELPHGPVRLAFTTDEEIGRGVDLFDVARFGADFAYTLDGGPLGELEYENFNAAAAKITIRGKSAHPGDAGPDNREQMFAAGDNERRRVVGPKSRKMVSAIRIAMEIDAELPPGERAETTAGRDGFYHLTRLSGTVESAEMEYLVREFDDAGFAARKETLRQIVSRFPEAAIAIEDQYLNMRPAVERHPEVIRRAVDAMRGAGVEPLIGAARGGTDGARLSRPLPVSVSSADAAPESCMSATSEPWSVSSVAPAPVSAPVPMSVPLSAPAAEPAIVSESALMSANPVEAALASELVSAPAPASALMSPNPVEATHAPEPAPAPASEPASLPVPASEPAASESEPASKLSGPISPLGPADDFPTESRAACVLPSVPTLMATTLPVSLPCPNLFTGGERFHSLDERVSISAMRKAVEVVVRIVVGAR